MPEIVRRKTIRPSTRNDTSVNYRVHINGISASDTLVVNIDHESKPLKKTYKFRGGDVLKKKSLGFKVREFGTHTEITWISTQPING